jgi:hypothetical protein
MIDWQEISGSWLLLPKQPKGIIHFLGGAFVATAPQVTYRCLLETLAKQGYVIVATPFVNTLDHGAIARNVLNRFESILERLQQTNQLSVGYLPIYGIGHSMGCKLHLLIGSLFNVNRAGNILISYNNYPANQAIPFLEQLQISAAPFFKQLQVNINDFNVEFSPSPTETNEIVAENYSVRRNLLVTFTDDTIDQASLLTPVLQARFPQMVTVQTLKGNHLTPLSQDLQWQPGQEFTPFDAVGQWLKQSLSRDLNALNREISRWLNPVLS